MRPFTKRLCVWGCVAAVLGLAIVLCPFTRDPIANSWRLWRMERQLTSLPHPSNSARVRLRSRVGLLCGNGNHCDYFVGELRTIEGPKTAIEDHYRGLHIRNPVTGTDEGVEILFVENGEIPEAWLPDEFSSIRGWELNDSEARRPMYLVYVFRSYEDNWDRRCW